ncbi:MAG: helix-turn-helix domain-containing protein [Mycobacterium sp.]
MRRRKFSIVFGEIVRQHRNALDLSQEALAERASVHANHVGLVERGERAPSIDIAQRIAAALGLSLSALVAEVERRWERSRSR